MDTKVQSSFVEQQDPRLGRQVVHDPRSRNFRAPLPNSSDPLRTVQHRRYDPWPEPNQEVGCCTMVAECMMGNTKGNRVMGEVLNMEDAVKGYARATELDPFPGTYPPDDTGSSGLAAAKVAVEMGISFRYDWYFGVDEILRGLQDHPISFGGMWTWDMFKADKNNAVIRPTGEIAGGHQWLLSGYDDNDEMIVGECWWGKEFGINGRFYMTVSDFRVLVDNYGDAHYSYRKLS